MMGVSRFTRWFHEVPKLGYNPYHLYCSPPPVLACWQNNVIVTWHYFCRHLAKNLISHLYKNEFFIFLLFHMFIRQKTLYHVHLAKNIISIFISTLSIWYKVFCQMKRQKCDIRFFAIWYFAIMWYKVFWHPNFPVNPRFSCMGRYLGTCGIPCGLHWYKNSIFEKNVI